MMFEYNGAKINYQFVNRGNERVTLLLHGWGCSGKIFEKFMKMFDDRSFLVVDFPPFGDSKSLPCSWTIFSYASMIISLCEHLNIKTVDILGHSFGGRIALILSSLKCIDVHSCILVDSAGIKPKKSLKKAFKVAIYKLKKKMGKNVDDYGSNDYKSLPPCMRGVFTNIVNTNLQPYLKQIEAQTLIVWGDQDNETPLYMAKRLNKHIKNSKLEVLHGGHFVFLDSPLSFYSVVEKFWEAI